MKTKAKENTQMRLKAAGEEISDLQIEFDIDWQDYLETIRSQERMLLLQQQLLETMVPLVRRDCNYYNLDRIRSECKFDEDSGKWVIPEVVLISSSVATINPVSKSPSHNPSPKSEPEYFKQHRAQEILAECNMMKEGLSPERIHRQFRGSIGTGGPGPTSTGLGNRVHQRNEAFARPQKLDSLVHTVANAGKGNDV